ncbi:hypothetical protein SPRG_06643 [Saprolegnia parasitica CBS 223.65]|uniref:GST N-terminal domain-containing protein n=1 Tax=Saprolegnia parasitica (strain CBS 223.65) TaxID=695850 RepID=A0A067CPE4_SAPPC|nr:hypothetical protein SPRG_06643 [Saprolegnia parasitica CBS 223.65]KDO28406.1 hypothetical protein SPRG_06643 [Saprolegnia parasitica CBS 223.65]|eukprot:XP_012200847.1 hypothetical protein SPRG_06643 [Saprolegnia parasitica CBS 223.65]
MAAATRAKHVLVTIPASNFCEKARWGLRAAKVDFVEEKHAPLFHYAGTVSKGGRSVPLLLVGGTKNILKSSDEIMTFCGKSLPALYPNDAVKAKELYYDNKFGPHARRYAYHTLFSMGPVGRAVLTDPLESAALSATVSAVYPVLKSLLIRSLNVTPDGAERSWAKIEAEFARVDDILGAAPLGSTYLAGPTFSAADISFCSHFQERYEYLRRSKAGQFVLYCYEHHYPLLPEAKL